MCALVDGLVVSGGSFTMVLLGGLYLDVFWATQRKGQQA
jgi:hypothetical protein